MEEIWSVQGGVNCSWPQNGAPSPSSLLPPQVVKQVLEQTSSGGFASNDTIIQTTLITLPFGGIGMSESPALPSQQCYLSLKG